MSAELTTHVLDTSSEGPANGVKVTLEKFDESGNIETVTSGVTNTDGRLEDPLLAGDKIEAGTYQLLFDVSAYYEEQSAASKFLDTVPVRFVIDDPEENYHVPLLLSPGGYTTYRGS